MNRRLVTRNGAAVAVVTAEKPLILDAASALELLMTVKYESNAERVAIDKACVTDGFFVLSTGLAGEILQKFINYHMKVAFFGDFTSYTSKPLHDFMYESNNGHDVFFAATEAEAVALLTR